MKKGTRRSGVLAQRWRLMYKKNNEKKKKKKKPKKKM